MSASPKKFKLAISPCPNDTFIFDALINGKIDTQGLQFECVFKDVEHLNKGAIQNEFDICKLSIFTMGIVSKEYQLLNSGAALGKGVGPLFISKKIFTNPSSEIKSVAVPGLNTTANFLFSHFFPEISVKRDMLFSQIEDAVLNEVTDAGVIIHENRFTYQQKGLVKIADLGELWEKKYSLPIPLGGIAVRRSFDIQTKMKIENLIRKSLEFSFSNPGQSMDFVRNHAQEMQEDVIKKHIELYVNQHSLDLGEDGKAAVKAMLEKAADAGMFPPLGINLFV
ncbi:MAG: 1,4-dihydroxy-6-naphthoate synthase [Bacteroidetes bacterium]|nr:MAG: 1,4-dihydroxy-6-naphthoate synthase [Bacteroidota bacterium]REK05112.1 MAG: 1,4-dihydroxy-6-naphthoate synthase [Bacteroidota bacterium]REK32517.1 MAG: 1,4-dihydroxy-6-naphthoate synthase [Bacteroidota bacterium]REK49036.1 MAG: 1,4-dihydroxy-6-naphthoate synthase [Bacteroidota bacterium]